MSAILSREDEDFEIIVAVPEEVEEIELPREKLKALIELLDTLNWDKRKLKRYVNAALRLRRLERERGKSYLSLFREYEKLSKEEVKLQYSISQLREKREKIEEDLRLYMEQHKLTLELVGRVAALISALEERGLGLEDLERGLNILENLKASGYDVDKLLEELSRHRRLSEEIGELEGRVETLRAKAERLEKERQALEEELREAYGILDGLRGLKEEIKRLRDERARVYEELESLRRDAEEIRGEVERLTGVKDSVEEAERVAEEKREEIERLRKEEAGLRREIGELLGVKGEVGEIREKVRDAEKEIERLEKIIEEKRAYVELLEGEMAAAYAILKLFSDPQGADVEDLDSLIQQLQTIAKVKRGEVKALRPLEPHLVERARQSIISLIMPYIRRELVPRKAFERIESELRRLNEKRLALEDEIASLRRALELRHRIEVVHRSEERGEEGYEAGEGVVAALTSEGETLPLRTLDQGKRVRVRCPYCRGSTVTRIPSISELEELAAKNYRLRFMCSNCGKFFEVDAESVLRRLRR